MTTSKSRQRAVSTCALGVVCVAVLAARSAQAGINAWTSNGPYGTTSVPVLVIDPQTPGTLYAATGAGVYSIRQIAARVGACGAGGTVAVNEIVTMVNIALGAMPIAECGSGDANHDNAITVDEIVPAVHHVLIGWD